MARAPARSVVHAISAAFTEDLTMHVTAQIEAFVVVVVLARKRFGRHEEQQKERTYTI